MYNHNLNLSSRVVPVIYTYFAYPYLVIINGILSYKLLYKVHCTLVFARFITQVKDYSIVKSPRIFSCGSEIIPSRTKKFLAKRDVKWVNAKEIHVILLAKL